MNNCYVFLFENKTTDNCLRFKKFKCFHRKLNKIVNFEENLRHSARLQSQAFKVYVRGVQTFLVIRPNFKENSMTGRKKISTNLWACFSHFRAMGLNLRCFFYKIIPKILLVVSLSLPFSQFVTSYKTLNQLNSLPSKQADVMMPSESLASPDIRNKDQLSHRITSVQYSTKLL